MVRKLIFVWFYFIYSLSAQAQVGFSIDGNARKVQIPFTTHSNLIVVPLIINDKLPLRFIVDTGVRNAILTDKIYTDMLRVGYNRKFTIRGAGGEFLIDAYLTNSLSLSMPGIKGRGHTLLVLENDFIELRNFLGTDVHGMLGYELFSRFVVELNYSRNMMVLYNPETFKAKRKYKRIPLEIEDTKPYIRIPVTMSDGSKIQARLLVDSGASHGILLEPQSGDSVVIPENTIDAIIGRGLSGNIEGRIGRIKEVDMAGYQISDPISTFPYPNSYMDSLFLNTAFRNGSIGGEVLSRFDVVFDYLGGYMYIKKNSAYKKDFFYNMSGITIKAIGANLNQFVIDEVRQGSNAWEAGVRRGDKILQVNGYNVKLLDLKGINAITNSKPGKRMTLTVERNGKQMKFIYYLKSAI